jgi:hypothetical protein
VRLQGAPDRAASKHLGDSGNLGKAGPLPDPSDGRTVDDAPLSESGEYGAISTRHVTPASRSAP